jgi:hypothetical protein
MDFIHSNHIGFVYYLECVSPDGEVRWQERWENLIPNEGRDYILNSALNGAAQLSTWYNGLYEGNYTPQATDTMATFVANATEITAYSGAARPVLVDDPLANGLFANTTTKAEFTFTADKTVRGGFISSGSLKGGTTGVLLSAVLGSSPKTVAAGEILRVTAGLSLVTV